MSLLPKERNHQIALIIIIAAISVGYGFYEYWYTPQLDGIDSLQARLDGLENRNRQARVVEARSADLEDDLVIYERHVRRLEELIPQNDEVPALLNSIVLEARRVGVEMGALNPGPSEAGEFYTEQSYEVAVVGDFHPVGRFLASIASLSRIITPIGLDVEPYTGTPPQETMVAPVTARFRVLTYVLPGAAGVAAVPADVGRVNE
ncbi:MAG: type 4a pilus biogenesis protein PilO [Gemmatimonadota bacterium]